MGSKECNPPISPTFLSILLVVAIAVLVVLGACKLLENPKSPTPCPTCSSTGRVTSSQEVALPFKIVDFKVTDRGFFNPDYLASVTVENEGDNDGTFTIFVDFIYNGIGTHTEEAKLFVRAHSTATKEIRYDADKRADSTRCRVRPPKVIQTTPAICPTCKGKGLLE